MSKKPFVNPSVRLKAKIKELRKEVKFWKNKHKRMVKKYDTLHERRNNIW
jgi:hypothetical protein